MICDVYRLLSGQQTLEISQMCWIGWIVSLRTHLLHDIWVDLLLILVCVHCEECAREEGEGTG